MDDANSGHEIVFTPADQDLVNFSGFVDPEIRHAAAILSNEDGGTRPIDPELRRLITSQALDIGDDPAAALGLK